MTTSPPKPADWTRREFVRGVAGVLALPHLRQETADKPRQHFAYVAGGEGDAGSICVFDSERRNTGWSLIQRVPSQSPAYLLHAPTQQMLYVANDVKMYDGLPQGTVEAFRVHPAEGTLTRLGCTPLSLSATHPRHLALSPDGAWLAVAAYGGGVYNVLPVAGDGSLGAPRGIFKDVGCGADRALQACAHPHTLLFDNAGKHLLATDFGSDRISVFAVEEGRLTRKSQQFTGAGSGPGACVLHPAGFVYTSHDLGNSIGSYRYASGTIGTRLHQVAGSRSAACGLALHPSGRTLYATDEESRALAVWQVDMRSGRLAHPQTLSLGQAAPTHISVAPDGRGVYILDSRRGAILRCTADAGTGALLGPAKLASLHAPRGIAVRAI